MLRQLLHRATQPTFPSDQLAAIREMRDELDVLELRVVLRMREAGFSWSEIARPMGITRQSLQKKVRRTP